MSEQKQENLQQAPTLSEQFQTMEPDKLIILIKEAMKEQKVLQNRNSKLQAKYVEVFKEHKLIKKDHAVFVAFFKKYFTLQEAKGQTDISNGKQKEYKQFSEQPLGQYQLQKLEQFIILRDTDFNKKLSAKQSEFNLQKIESQNMEKQLRAKIVELQQEREKKLKALREQIENSKTEALQKIKQENRLKIKNLAEDQTKQAQSQLREIQNLKKTNKKCLQTISELQKTIDDKNVELSKLNKEKLKLEHHLNNIRKKEISEELKEEDKDKIERMNAERNEFLSMRQQIQSLISKRDELKKELKQRDLEIEQEKKMNNLLQNQIENLKKIQSSLDQKYQLIRECSLEDLEDLILKNLTEKDEKEKQADNSEANKQKAVPKLTKEIELNQKQCLNEPQTSKNSQLIHRQYLKNIFIRFLKTESNGSMDQTLTLLEIITTLLKFNHQQNQVVTNYKNKRAQWWNLNRYY